MSGLPNWKKNKKTYDAAYRAEHYTRIVIDVPPEEKARLQEKAAARGMTLKGYILDCVERAE